VGRQAQEAMAELRETRKQDGAGAKGGKAAPAKRKVDAKGVKASGNGSSGRNAGTPVDKTPAGAGAAKAKPHPRSRKKKKRK
jgi:hypothetical protein